MLNSATTFWVHAPLGRAFRHPHCPLQPDLGFNLILCTRPQSPIMSDKKPEPKELSDEYILAAIAKESKEFDKVGLHPPTPYQLSLTHSQDAEIDRILKAFRLDAYAVLDLQPGVPDNDIKKCYRMKSLLIHPDKTTNPSAPDAFDRLAKAQQALLDEKERAKLDECIADARMLLIRERKLTIDSEEVKDPDDEFRKAWREKTKVVLVDEELRRRKRMKAQMQEEGRAQKKEEDEIAERKRKREFETKWEQSREERIGSWRDFQKGKQPDKKKKKIKTLG